MLQGRWRLQFANHAIYGSVGRGVIWPWSEEMLSREANIKHFSYIEKFPVERFSRFAEAARLKAPKLCVSIFSKPHSMRFDDSVSAVVRNTQFASGVNRFANNVFKHVIFLLFRWVEIGLPLPIAGKGFLLKLEARFVRLKHGRGFPAKGVGDE